MAGRTSLREKKLLEDFLKDPPWEEIEIQYIIGDMGFK